MVKQILETTTTPDAQPHAYTVKNDHIGLVLKNTHLLKKLACYLNGLLTFCATRVVVCLVGFYCTHTSTRFFPLALFTGVVVVEGVERTAAASSASAVAIAYILGSVYTHTNTDAFRDTETICKFKKVSAKRIS